MLLIVLASSLATIDLDVPYWLHVPKCGTQFAHTLVRHACPEKAHQFGNVKTTEELRSKAHSFRCNMTKLSGILPGHGGYDVKLHKKKTVAMFREPLERLCSLFMYWRNGQRYNVHQLKSLVANFPREANIYLTTLTNNQVGKHEDLLRIASNAILHELAFVGIVQYWKKSICLFHAMFNKLPIDENELLVGHKTAHYKENANSTNDIRYFDEKIGLLSSNYAGASDSFLYNIAIYRFHKDLKRYGKHCK